MQENNNHFPELEAAAEQVGAHAQSTGEIDAHLVAYLRQPRRHVDVPPARPRRAPCAATIRSERADAIRGDAAAAARSFQARAQIADRLPLT